MNSGNSLRDCIKYTLKTTRNFPITIFNFNLKNSSDFVRNAVEAGSRVNVTKNTEYRPKRRERDSNVPKNTVHSVESHVMPQLLPC